MPESTTAAPQTEASKVAITSSVDEETTQISAKSSPVKTDLFEVLAEKDGEVISIALHTDLPDDALVTVSVSRSIYWVDDIQSWEWGSDYYSNTSAVREWAAPVRVDVSEEKWKQVSRENLQTLAKMPNAKITRFGDTLNVSALFTTARNPSLKSIRGQVIEQATKSFRVATSEISLLIGLVDGHSLVNIYASPLSLVPGSVYKIDVDVPLMSEAPDSANIQNVGTSYLIKAGGSFEVIIAKKFEGKPWYMVSLTDRRVGDMVVGWINSTALIGGNLQIVD